MDPHADPDWALWHSACEGDAASAATLVRRLTPQALGLAVRLLGRREDAEDMVQEAFLRLWRSRPSDARGARLATYFNTIVINRCRTAAVARREEATDPERLTALHDEAPATSGWAPLPGVGAAVGAAAAVAYGEAWAPHGRGGIAGRLQRAIATLPVRQRQAIALWAWGDADGAEIARALELEPNAAHQLLYRARQALKACLEGKEP